jgi:hypothetical protein
LSGVVTQVPVKTMPGSKLRDLFAAKQEPTVGGSAVWQGTTSGAAAAAPPHSDTPHLHLQVPLANHSLAEKGARGASEHCTRLTHTA